MNTAKREIDDFALSVKERDRREAAAIAKPPADLFYSRLYPGQDFAIKGTRWHRLVVTFNDDISGKMFSRLDCRDGTLSPEFRLSQSDFYATISNPPTL